MKYKLRLKYIHNAQIADNTDSTLGGNGKTKNVTVEIAIVKPNPSYIADRFIELWR